MIKFPQHKGSLTLTHNGHKDYYEAVESYERSSFPESPIGWVSEEQRRKAIEADDVWVLQWYPETPIGFVRLAACDLSALLEAALAEGKLL